MRPSPTRRNGVVVVFVALSLVMLLGMAGIAVDLSRLYLQRAKAQRAADAAALAGAVRMAQGYNKTTADVAAQNLAANNGYDTTKGATLTTTYPVPNNPNWYKVSLSKPETLFFMGLFGFHTKQIGATATALYEQPVEIDITGGNTSYGATGRMNLSVYGADAYKQHGDAYSPKWLDSYSAAFIPGASSGDPNPDYTPDGYDFTINIPNNYSSLNNGSTDVTVEIFDPDSYNSGGNNANGTQRVDEIRSAFTSGAPTATTTVYTLYYTNGTADTSDDIQIATKSYSNGSSTDMQWVKPNSDFTFDLNDSTWSAHAYDPNAFRINVRGISGGSENGFSLRAGPPLPTVTNTRRRNGRTEYYYNGAWHSSRPEFDPDNGTSITAQGRIPINFNSSGTVTVKLGYIPAGATSFYVDKFDTDVGSQSVSYSDGSNNFAGVLTKNAQHLRDAYTLPNNYGGGTWYATYTAGQQDTSSWSMYYSGPAVNKPGTVRLIR
jgi:hypothetical protein